MSWRFWKKIKKGKVLVVIITKDTVRKSCMDSVKAQDYKDFEILVNVKEPRYKHIDSNAFDESMKRCMITYLNCSENREEARKKALKSDAEYFFFVDSDVVLPRNAISEFMKQPFDVQGGWYNVRHEHRYTCARWVADNVSINLYHVEPSLVKVDSIGMGCAFISRKALRRIYFEHGIDDRATTYMGGKKYHLVLGECGALGNLLHKKGIQPYMNGSVVCKHDYVKAKGI